MLIQTIAACAQRTAPFSLVDAQALLSSLTAQQQAQLISALYMGRNAIHQTKFTEDDAPYATPQGLTQYTDHIPPADYARILSEKGLNTITYFQRFLACAKNAGLIV